MRGDIHLVFLKLWNASSEPILSSEYKVNAIPMNFGKEAKVFSVQVLESKPPTIKEEIDDNKLISFDAGKVFLTPIWLNMDNSLTLKVLVSNFQGDVSTDESRIIVGGYISNWDKTINRKIINLVEKTLSPIYTSTIFISFILLIIEMYIIEVVYHIHSVDFIWLAVIFISWIISAVIIYFILKLILNRMHNIYS